MSHKQFIRFTNDAAGLERILRLFQAFSQIFAVYAVTVAETKIWHLLRHQFALGRRYIRFFRFLDCFSKAYDLLDGGNGLEAVLLVGKWSCMGGYLALESATILDAMGVWKSSWSEACMLEANKLWFYALIFSIAAGWMEYLRESKEKDSPPVKAIRKASKPPSTLRSTRHIKRRVVTDAFDLFIPGAITGWIPTSPAWVGFATIISTVLSSKDIWDRLR